MKIHGGTISNKRPALDGLYHTISKKCKTSVLEVPNDMKMLAMLGGELSNSATFFSTFANVSTKECTDLGGTFGSRPSCKWKPWKYANRLKDAKAVDSFKVSLDGKPLLAKHKRSKEAVAKSYIPSTCKTFAEVQKDTSLGRLVTALKCEVKAGCLAKKVRKWFDKTQAYIGVRLRDLCSIINRFEVEDTHLEQLQQLAKEYYRANALLLPTSVNPTIWTISHVVAAHARQVHDKYGQGLLTVTMEGKKSQTYSFTEVKCKHYIPTSMG
ncbi:unnamed protein product [Pocillopora meandrina]|uniref:Uncharacterized protein n=1 Tax=Pocillopora meandrina TaxID=46732 RepID=A0AAU9XRM1_9CNID|nr:unnamed protein product [Pocillopora meandrina]